MLRIVPRPTVTLGITWAGALKLAAVSVVVGILVLYRYEARRSPIDPNASIRAGSELERAKARTR